MDDRVACTPRRVRLVGMVGALALTTTLLVGIGGTSATARAPSASTPKPGGSIVYGLEAETGGGWCPANDRLAISGIMVGTAVYDTLVVPNSKGQMVPYLAKSLDHSPDYTKWTITLRDGVKFQDGTPLTADAVKLNLDTYRTNPLSGAALKDISDVAVTGPLQVTVTASRPWPALPWLLYFDGRILIAAPAQINSPDCATKLIGTGPFEFDHWTVNQELVVTKNPAYWQKDAKGRQLPYLDKITFKPYAEADQRVNALESGQADVIQTSDGMQIDALQQQKSNYNLMLQGPGRREIRYYLMNAAKPPLDDLNARKAVAMAIDRNQINQLRNDGVKQVADGPFDKDVPGYVKNPGYPKFDPKQAKKLANAYKAAHGGKFSVVLEHTNDPANTQEAELIKEQLAKAGIDATLKQDDQTAFITAAISGNFSIMLWRNHPGDDPDANYQWWSSGSILNFGKFADPKLQTLLDQGRVATDPAKRAQIYQKVDKLFASQVYNVWSYYDNWLIATKKNVQGLMGPPLPDGGGNALFIYGRHPLLGIYLSK